MPPRKLPRKSNEAEAPKKTNALAQARALLTKAFPKDESFVTIDEESFKESRPHLPTGSIVLDYLIGGRVNRYGVRPCPGFPKKCILNLYGQESAGKTTVALTAAAMVCASGGTVCYIDWENAIDVAYAKVLGIPLDDPLTFELAQPESLEKGLAIMWTMAKAGVDLIVIDSVGAGVPKASLEQTLQDRGEGGMGRIGLNAAKWSYILPELKSIINRTGTCVLGISQLRKKIATGPMAGHGPDSDAQGGNAWKFYSEVRMGLQRVAQDKGKEYNALTHKVEEATVSQTVKCRIDKCKVSAAQGKTADFYIKFGEGVDDLRSVIEITSAHGIVKKTGAWYAFERPNGTVIKGCGMDEFKTKVKEAEGAWDEIYLAAIDAMSKKPGDFVTIVEEPLEDDGLADLEALMTAMVPTENPGNTSDEG
jgi:recombination protein RecA